MLLNLLRLAVATGFPVQVVIRLRSTMWRVVAGELKNLYLCPLGDAAASDVGYVAWVRKSSLGRGVSVGLDLSWSSRFSGWREDDGALERRDGFWYLNNFRAPCLVGKLNSG